MKELSVEEKAKRYDEALKAAIVASKDEDRRLKATLERIFPELKKSEDERIRNFISNELACLRAADKKGTVRYNELTEAIAWVEKQGEHAKFRDSIQVGDKVTRNKDGVLVNLSQLKRVAKPTEEYNITGIGSKHAEGKLKELIEKQGEQKPAEWNKNDEALLDETLHFIREFQQSDRCIDEGDMQNSVTCKNWLKSLKDRYTWKPSDEQMKALAEALSLAKNCGEEYAFDLRTLQDQLKKLMGE